MALNTNRYQEIDSLIAKARKQKKNIEVYLFQHGVSEAEYINYIAVTEESIPEVVISEEEEDDSTGLEFSNENYVYNKDTDVYCVFLKSAPKPLIIKGSTHRAILENYSAWNANSLTINEICRKFKIPRKYFEEYKRIFSITKDREGLSQEEVLKNSVDESVTSLLESKRWSIHQKYLKEDWKQIKQNSDKWTEFKATKLDPFTQFIENWNPPKFEPLKLDKKSSKGTKVFLCGLNDLQIGDYAEERKMNHGKEFNTKIAVKKIQQYAQSIVDDIKGYSYEFEKAVLVLNGDLWHGFLGETARGTKLKVDTIKEEQFDAAFNSIINFILGIQTVFNKVEIHSNTGNHEGFWSYVFMKALKAYFRTDDRIDITIHDTRASIFKVLNTLVITDHGDSDTIKAPIPKAGSAQKSWVQTLMLSRPELLIGTNQKIFITADLHAYEQRDYGDFEFFRFGALPSGSEYADALNLKNRARQNCLVIDESGVKSVFHYFLD